MTAGHLHPLTIFSKTSPAFRAVATELALRDRGREAVEAIQAAIVGQTDADGSVEGLLVAMRGQRLAAALPLRFQPGRTAQLWTPRLAAEEGPQTATFICEQAVEVARQRQCSLVQALPENGHPGELALLEAVAFRHVADLFYMVAPLENLMDEPPALDLQLAALAAGDPQRLAAIIDRTYVGTHDCPALNGVRCLDDVLEGYRAIGRYDPAYWFIVRREGEDLGCLLLANHNDSGQWELVYLGLVPEARGAGYALPLVRHAQCLARAAGARQLVLAVDADNAPAIRAYLASGFVVWDRRPIYLRVLTARSGGV